MINGFSHYLHKRTLLQMLFDFGLVWVVVVLSTLTQVTDLLSASSSIVTTSVLLAVGILAINVGLGFYQRAQMRSLGQAPARIVLSVCLSLALAYAIVGLSSLHLQDESVFTLLLIGGVALVLMYRIYASHATPIAVRRQRVLVFGSGARARVVGNLLVHTDPNIDLVGYYASPNEDVTEAPAPQLLSPKKTLTDVVQERHVDEIVVALAERRGGSMPLRELLDCKLHGVRVVDAATHFEHALGQIRRDAVSAGWLIFGDGFEQGRLRTLVKRLFDMVFATLLIGLTLPLMLLTSILIRLESAGPILYRQERVGLNGRLFNVVKFRSMRTDAEKDGQPRWAALTDDRVTRIGRVIRKLRIDELPQLFSVLGGDMSLVGPRPERPYFVDQLTRELAFYAVRHSVKPGVTGWAQVRYHYGASVDDAAEKLQYDLYYVKNHSLLLDLLVLFQTVGVVLGGKGAH